MRVCFSKGEFALFDNGVCFFENASIFLKMGVGRFYFQSLSTCCSCSTEDKLKLKKHLVSQLTYSRRKRSLLTYRFCLFTK